jgi:hypothetical protein
MGTIELQLDERTLERARHSRIPPLRPEEFIREISSQLAGAEAANNPSLGMLGPELELIDQPMESVMKAREQHPLRQSRGQLYRHGHVFEILKGINRHTVGHAMNRRPP